MPITQAEKEQLQNIILKADSSELVRIAGSIYDCVLKANLETDKLLAIGKHLYARVRWSNVPAGLNDARLKILRSAEENFLQQLPNFFAVSETPPPQTEEPQATAPATDGEARALSPANHHAAVVKQYPKNWKPSGSNQGQKENRKGDQPDQRGENHGR